MDPHSSSNDDSGRPSNSLQLYRMDQERGQLAAGVGSPHEVRREFAVCHHPAGATAVPQMHSHMPQGYAVGAPPPGTKMLVDPATGQQYFVPTAQPQVAYYPVYYPQSQPIFYQPAPAGYFMPSHQHSQVPSSPTHHSTGAQPMFFPSPSSTASQPPPPPSNYVSTAAMPNASYAHSQAYGSPPYHVEIPPSNASVSSSHFQRNHESRVSMESGASSASGSSRNKHSDDSVSPALHHVGRPTVGAADGQTPTSARGATKLFPDNWLHNSARYSSATSSSSGFYSGDMTLEKSHLSTRLSGASDTQGSPTHRPTAGGEAQPKPAVRPQPQPQQWWHDGDSPRTNINMQSPRREEKSPMYGSPLRGDSSALDRRHSVSPAPPTDQPPNVEPLPPPRPTQKSIRMDFDLNDLSIAVDQPTTPIAVEKAKMNVTPATAFTISFDDNDSLAAGDDATHPIVTSTGGPVEGRSPKKTSLSLQDAARQAPTGRRLLRRSAAPSKPSADATRQDPKEYLFSKMFEHNNGAARNEPSHQDLDGSLGISQFGATREMDTASEAGTYIVEKDMRTSQVLSTDEDESSSVVSSSTSSSTTTISDNGGGSNDQPSPRLVQRPTAVRPENPTASAMLLRPRPSATAGAMTAAAEPKSPPSARRSLMSDLRRLRDEKGDQSPTSPRRALPAMAAKSPVQKSAASSTGFLPSIATASGGQAKTTGGPPTRLCQSRFAVGGGGGVGSNANAFRPGARCHSETRADGGRFSMRTTGGASSAVYRPGTNAPAVRPRNAVVRPTPAPNRPAQDTPEMVAWLRRKEYDPRKAAAEARKMQQLKQSLIKLASGCDKVLETELGQRQPSARLTAAISPSKKWLEETYLANRSMSYQNAGGFLSSANSAFQQWHKPPNCNKSYDNLSCLGEESGAGCSLDDFAQLTIVQTSNNLKRTVDALTEKCNKSIELIKLCNKNALSPSVENLLQSVVESSVQPSVDRPEDSGGEEEENGAKISDRLEQLNSAFDAIQKYLEEQSSSTAASTTKLLDLMPSSSVVSPSSSSAAGVEHRPTGSSTQRFLLGISELANARHAVASSIDRSPTDGKDENDDGRL